MPEHTIFEHHRLVQAVAMNLRHRCGVGATPGTAVLVATSGGADSVGLLRAMAALAPRRRWRLALTVAHVQHHLRPCAEDDARFVEALAAQLGLPYRRADLDLTGGTGNLEARARRQRYGALARLARDSGAALIATAHHGDDQLETLLMRLLRGASVTGLGGIAWRRRLPPPPEWAAEMGREDAGDPQAGGGSGGSGGAGASGGAPLHLIRPLLSLDRSAVRDFLRDIGQPWREDPTNEDLSRLRARLRREVLPVLHELQPRVAQRALAVGEHMREMARLLETATAEARAALVRPAGQGAWEVDRAAARRLPRAVLAGLLRGLLMEAGAAPDTLSRHSLAPLLRAVYDARGGVRRFTFSGGVEATLHRDRLILDAGWRR